MNRILYVLIIVLFVFPFYSRGGEVLDDLLNPLSMEIDDNQIYFTEGSKIYIYSLNDLKLVNVFGKAGKEFPSHFSNIQSSIVSDNKIYMQTYRRDGEKAEFIIYGTNGKYIGTKMIPFQDQSIVRPYPYQISKNKFYQIVENDDEEWELIITDIK